VTTARIIISFYSLLVLGCLGVMAHSNIMLRRRRNYEAQLGRAVRVGFERGMEEYARGSLPPDPPIKPSHWEAHWTHAERDHALTRNTTFAIRIGRLGGWHTADVLADLAEAETYDAAEAARSIEAGFEALLRDEAGGEGMAA
jgi:hypothetical protein